MTRPSAAALPAAVLLALMAPPALAAQYSLPSTSVERSSRAPAATGPRLSRTAAPAIVGTVRDTTGRPLANAQIVVGVVNRALQSDANGGFVIRGLAPGVYHLDVSLIGYAGRHLVVTVPESGPDVVLEIVLRPSALRLTGVLVSAAPSGSDALGVTQAAVELSGKGLALNLGNSVAQTLANEPGMAMRFNGPMANMPVIRGLTGDRILVLQDGERAGDLASSSADHALSIDPFSAERIEVIRGPASLLYGNNALGGVVNVIANDIPTDIPSRATFFLGGQGESVTPGGVAGGGATIPLGKRGAMIARGNWRSTDDLRVGGKGTLTNTDVSSTGGSLGLGYVGERAHVGIALRGTAFEFGVPFPPGGEPIRLDGNRTQVALRSTFNTGAAAIPTIRVDGTVQHYTHDEIEPDGAVGTNFRLNTQTFNVNARTQTGRLTGTIGLQGYLRDYRPTGEEAFTPSATNRNVGLLLFQDVPLRPAARPDARVPRLQLGARYDWFALKSREDEARFGPAQERTFNSASASLGLSLPLGPASTFSVNAQRAFRAPAVEEVFADGYHVAAGTYDVGNRDLEAESSTGLEGIFRTQGTRGFAQVSGYVNAIADYIAPVAVGTREVEGEDGPAEVPLVNFIQRDARLVGVELQGEAEVARHWVVGASADWVRGRFNDQAESRNLPFIPAGRLGATLRWDNGRLSFGGGVRRVLRQSRVSGDALDVPTSSYTLANLSIGWTVFAGATVQNVVLRADNVFDEIAYDATSRIKSFASNPGRNLTLVYKVMF